MDNQPLQQQAKQIAVAYSLDPLLVCAVCEQESSWDTYAIRYEPHFFLKYVAHQVNLSDTERMARATSWGLMQIMGQTARERGFNQKYLSALSDPDFGLHRGCEFLKHCLELASRNVEAALLKWNGGSNPDYPKQVLVRMEKYR